jgi:hypothetical protein
MAGTARQTSPRIAAPEPLDGEFVAEVAGVAYDALGREDGAVLLRRSVERVRRPPSRTTSQHSCAGHRDGTRKLP